MYPTAATLELLQHSAIIIYKAKKLLLKTFSDDVIFISYDISYLTNCKRKITFNPVQRLCLRTEPIKLQLFR